MCPRRRRFPHFLHENLYRQDLAGQITCAAHQGMKRSVEMVNRTMSIFVGAALAIAVSLSTVGRADDREKNAVQNATVHFGQPQPQTPDPAPPAGANGAQVTHFLLPDD